MPELTSSRPSAPAAAAGSRESGERPAAGRSPRRRRSAGATPYLFLAPGFLLFLGLIIYPTVRAFQISFYDWKILAGATSQFIGLDNYLQAYHDPIFWRSLANSGIYMALSVPPQIALGLFVAMLLRAKAPGQVLYRVLFYLPVVTSWVVASLLFRYLFSDSGLANYLLHAAHVTNGDTSWLSNRWTAMAAISILGVWKGIGWSMMIFLAALQAVPRDLEEAAAVDGAGAWRRFTTVTWPAIWPATVFVTVMLVIGGFNVFTSVLLMTGGGPADQTQVLLTYMYEQTFTYLDFGYGSALAVVLTILVFVLSLFQIRIFRNRTA